MNHAKDIYTEVVKNWCAQLLFKYLLFKVINIIVLFILYLIICFSVCGEDIADSFPCE